MPDSNEFKNKTVLVTGATGGIGHGIALGFARAGADEAVHYHSRQAFAAELSGLAEPVPRQREDPDRRQRSGDHDHQPSGGVAR
jgi:NAD(P)-dependent dehydrogenase (short-subunit alcohol dehydrogenase family)